MPFVRRTSSGQIERLHRQPDEGPNECSSLRLFGDSGFADAVGDAGLADLG